MPEQDIEMTLFGRMISRRLEERGIENLADVPLDRKTRAAIERRMWIKGKPVRDLGLFADVLELSEPEKLRLAWAYVYDGGNDPLAS